jgi:hypothetical protein
MKLTAHSVMASYGFQVLPRWRNAVRDERQSVDVDSSMQSAMTPRSGLVLSGPVRAVVIMAFCQSLVLLFLWLFICASAGASTGDGQAVGAGMQKSSYAPTQARDPFVVRLPVVATPVTTRVETMDDDKNPDEATAVPAVNLVAVAFNLQGTLYQSGNPIALVNGAMLSLNKSATIVVGNHRLEVTPVEITRERVKLRAGDQTVELKMVSPRSTVEVPENLLR